MDVESSSFAGLHGPFFTCLMGISSDPFIWRLSLGPLAKRRGLCTSPLPALASGTMSCRTAQPYFIGQHSSQAPPHKHNFSYPLWFSITFLILWSIFKYAQIHVYMTTPYLWVFNLFNAPAPASAGVSQKPLNFLSRVFLYMSSEKRMGLLIGIFVGV